MPDAVLAIDAGTTSVRALLVDPDELEREGVTGTEPALPSSGASHLPVAVS